MSYRVPKEFRDPPLPKVTSAKLFVQLLGAPETHQLDIDPPETIYYSDRIGELLMAWLDETIGDGSTYIEGDWQGNFSFVHTHGPADSPIQTAGVAKIYTRTLQ